MLPSRRSIFSKPQLLRSISSRQRSSTTREYIGAVNHLAALREGRGEFETEEEFYRYWRAYPFRTGRAVEQQVQEEVQE